MIPLQSHNPPKLTHGQYLATREWALLKRRVRERSGGRCERCHHTMGSQIHHVTYERFGHERLEDLLDLCGPCHEYLSGVRDDDPLDLIPKPFNEREWRELQEKRRG